MTPDQTRKYFWEWARVRDALISRGFVGTQADEKRHDLHVKALGRDKSSKKFTNADLDAVLATFRAVWDGGNIDAQLWIQDSPDKVRAQLLARCEEVCGRMFSHGNDLRLAKADNRTGYIRGTARNVVKREIDDCTNAQLGIVLGCLEKRLDRLVAECAARSEKKTTAPAAEADGEGNPF